MNRYLLFYYVPQDGPEKTMRQMPKSLKGAFIAVFCFVLSALSSSKRRYSQNEVPDRDKRQNGYDYHEMKKVLVIIRTV